MSPESGEDASRINARRVLTGLGQRGWTLAVAESLTGGMLASALVDIPGASACLRGGIVAYATDLKESMLGVDAVLLDAEGPVRPSVAAQMADGVRAALGRAGEPADVGISTTGIAGPDSPDGQPVGTVHLGLSTPHRTIVRSLLLTGDRRQIRIAACRSALVFAAEEIT